MNTAVDGRDIPKRECREEISRKETGGKKYPGERTAGKKSQKETGGKNDLGNGNHPLGKKNKKNAAAANDSDQTIQQAYY